MEKKAKKTDGSTSEATWWQMATVMSARLVVISGFVAILALLLPGDSLAFYAFMAFAYIATIPYALWLKNRARTRGFLPVQFVVDLLWVTGLVYFTGGMDSDLTLLYPLVILSAGVVSDPLRAMQIAILSALSYVLLVVLMLQGILVSYQPMPDVGWAHIARTMGLRVFILMLFGLVSAYVSQRCHFADAKLQKFRHVSEIIFRNVRAGLMLLDEQGKILMANERACNLLQQAEDELVGCELSHLLTGDYRLEPTDETKDPSPCYFKRSGGEEFPVSYEMSLISLPEEMIPHARGKGTINVLIMVFSDLTSLIKMQETARYVEQMRAATQVASEIAHEIRSPLTAISGSLQLLNKLEKEASTGNKESMLLLDEERDAIHENVVKETLRLDYIVEKFINVASFSPEAVTELLQLSRQLKPGRAVTPPSTSEEA